MIWFFRASKTILVIFIISCLLRLAFVFMLNSGYISMSNDTKKGNVTGIKDNNNSKNNINSKNNNPKYSNKPGNNDNNNSTGNQVTPQNKNPQNTKSSPDNKSDEAGEYVLTSKEVGLINNISLKDKISGFSILCKLNKEDIDKILGIINDGITMGEYKELEVIFKKSLSQKDMDVLNELMLKNKRLYAEGKIED